MSISDQQLNLWLNANEDEHLEFKEARNTFHFEKLVKYCAALANEGGGSIILGVSDKSPRRIVGCQAFEDLERTKAGLVDRLRLRIDASEIKHPDGRVLVFTAPPRPIGMPVAVEGAYWMRAGEDLVPMTPDLLRRIFEEAGPDYTSEICLEATLADLDPTAIEAFRERWSKHSGNQGLKKRSVQKLLQDAELVLPQGVTYAALALLGTQTALGRHLAQAEVIFEYRATSRPGPANQRVEFRQGFFSYCDRIWELVNLRNDTQHFQDGLVMHPVPTFSEGAVREALLNAVSHRDYRHPGSVFVRQFPRSIEIVSPGGFPAGITPENILDRQLPRNRRIAETFGRCGLVERSGQGADRIVEECVRHGQGLPDYSRSDVHQVWLRLDGEIQDVNFLKFLRRIDDQILETFDPHDYWLLGLIGSGQKLPAALLPHTSRLVEIGVLDRSGRGKLILAKRIYSAGSGSTTKTMERAQARQRDVAALLDYIYRHQEEGVPLKQLLEVCPSLTRDQVKRLLKELREAGTVVAKGGSKTARWFPSTE